YIMRALEPEVFDAVYETVEHLLPRPTRTHPLEYHRPASRHRDPAPRQRLRLPENPPRADRSWPGRSRHPETRNQSPVRDPDPARSRSPLDRRGRQLLVIELRPTPPLDGSRSPAPS